MNQLWTPLAAARVLTIKQPWLHLILTGVKPIENRTWTRHYRGPLILTASATPDRHALRLPYVIDALDGFTDFPLGVVAGTVTLTDIHPDQSCHRDSWGETGPGVYHWSFTDPNRLPEPIDWSGAQGLRHATPDLLDTINAQFLRLTSTPGITVPRPDRETAA